MNPIRGKKKAAMLLRLRKMKAQIAATKKTLSLRQQKQAFQEWRQAKKNAQDYESSRNKGATAAMHAICTKISVSRIDLEYEYANFSWKTEQLKELRQIIEKKAEEHTQKVEKTRQTRIEHIHCENKADQAVRLYKQAKHALRQQLLHAESEENEEIATTRHILKSAKK